MFKKPKRRKNVKKRKIEDESDDEAPSSNVATATVNAQEPTSTSTLTRIQSVKNARRIKNQFRSRIQSELKQKQNRNGNTNANAEAEREREEQEKLLAEANQDLRKRLEGNFATNGGATNDEDTNALTKKHKLAMERYVSKHLQSKLNHMNGGSAQGNEDVDRDAHVDADADKNTSGPTEIRNTTDLYSKILHESTEIAMDTQISEKEEEGVGAGGAMLGGTGIAEVILPVEDRIKAAKETELAAARRQKKRMGSGQMFHADDREGSQRARERSMDYDDKAFSQLPLSFGSGPGKDRKQLTNNSRSRITKSSFSQKMPKDANDDGIVTGTRVLNKNIMPEIEIGSSYAHNFRLHKEEWVFNKKKEEEHRKSSTNTVEDNEVDRSRVGFEVRRGIRAHKDGDGDYRQKIQRANDDRTYNQFVSREFKKSKR